MKKEIQQRQEQEEKFYLQLKKEFSKKIAVEVEKVSNYVDAEEYHQKYLEKNPQGYCHIGKCFFG